MKNLLGALIIVGVLGPAQLNGLTYSDMPQPRVIGFYSGFNFKDAKVRLDALVSALHQDPHSQGYIMAYAGKRARRGEAAARGLWAKEYLVKARGVDARRIVMIDGGHREAWTVELWIVPSGGVPPYSIPTVDPNKVQITGGSVKGRRHRVKS